MDPATINALVNMGSAGAVIVVVVIFLKTQEKRDKQWQDFFTAISGISQARLDVMKNVTDKIQTHLEKLIGSLDDHDGQAKEIKTLIVELRRDIERLQPGRTTRPKQ